LSKKKIKADDIYGGIQAATNPLSPGKGKLILLLIKQRYMKVQFTKGYREDDNREDCGSKCISIPEYGTFFD
jgi:hypothetical protein